MFRLRRHFTNACESSAVNMAGVMSVACFDKTGALTDDALVYDGALVSSAAPVATDRGFSSFWRLSRVGSSTSATRAPRPSQRTRSASSRARVLWRVHHRHRNRQNGPSLCRVGRGGQALPQPEEETAASNSRSIVVVVVVEVVDVNLFVCTRSVIRNIECFVGGRRWKKTLLLLVPLLAVICLAQEEARAAYVDLSVLGTCVNGVAATRKKKKDPQASRCQTQGDIHKTKLSRLQVPVIRAHEVPSSSRCRRDTRGFLPPSSQKSRVQ